MYQKFETQIANFLIRNNTIEKQFKFDYQHLFEKNYFSKLLTLNSKYLIKLYKIDIDNQILVFEYFKSKTLREFLKQNIKIEFNDLLNILYSVAQGIDDLHHNKIYHIDINDTNILVDDNFNIKINDFDFMEIDNKELIQIDIHSFSLLVFRIILLPKQWKSISHLEFKYDINNLDFSNCKNFIKSLKIKKE